MVAAHGGKGPVLHPVNSNQMPGAAPRKVCLTVFNIAVILVLLTMPSFSSERSGMPAGGCNRTPFPI